MYNLIQVPTIPSGGRIMKGQGRLPIDGGLRRIFREQMPDAQWTPIETGATAPGTPDSEYCFPDGRSGWIEFKRAQGFQVILRPLQIAWIGRRTRLGGRVHVGIRKRTAEADCLIIVPGSALPELTGSGFKGFGEMHWFRARTPAGWDWDRLRKMLTD